MTKKDPVIFKLNFILAKHAMIRSNELKVNMIDRYKIKRIFRRKNYLELKEFTKF